MPPKCALHKVHHPAVTATVMWPLGETFVEVCPTGAANLDMAVNYLTGNVREMPVRVGKETWDLATAKVRGEAKARHPAGSALR